MPGDEDAVAPGAYDEVLKPGARVASTLNAAAEGEGRTNINAAADPEVLTRIATLLADGSLALPISATYDLADAPAALADLGAEHTQGKLAIRVA